jgi:hypothetical protein
MEVRCSCMAGGELRCMEVGGLARVALGEARCVLVSMADK